MAHDQYLADDPVGVSRTQTASRLFLLALLGVLLGAALGLAGYRSLRPPAPVAGLPELVYWRVGGGQPGIWAIRADGSAPRLLIPIAGEIHPFAVGPGGQIAYSVDRPDGGADLWLYPTDGPSRLLVACPQAICESPVWAPDGRLAYVRRSIESQGTASVWLWAGTGQQPLAGDEPGEQPRWAPAGNRLATYRPDMRAIVLRDLSQGVTTIWPSEVGDLGTWSPDGTRLVFGDAVAVPEPTTEPFVAGQAESTASPRVSSEGDGFADDDTDRFNVHLFLAGLDQNPPIDLSALSPSGAINDAGAVWSPDGSWIAFGRQSSGSGRQLMLLDPASGASQALTSEPNFNHAAFAWSPVPLPGHTALSLAMVRKDITDATAPPGIWLIDADGQNLRLLAPDGILPAWKEVGK